MNGELPPATPDNPVASALTLFQARRLQEALPLLEQLVEAGNTPLSCVLALAETREGTGNAAGAIRLLENLYNAMPQEDFAVVLTAALLRAGEPAPLDAWLPRLLAAHPDSMRLLAMRSEHALKRGDFAAGFDLMHHRWAISRTPRMTASLACPEWNGDVFDGILLVGTEQGLGDVVLWSSLFGELVARGQRALVACDARLLSLFRRSFPTLEFADQKQMPLLAPGNDLRNRRIESADLARMFRRSPADFPARRAWLHADPARVATLRAEYRARFPGKRLLGLSWCSHRDLRGESKSMPLADLEPLLAMPDTVVVSLQYGDTSRELAALRAGDRDIHVDPAIDLTNDIDSVCALACALDAVVSSSNTMAHLLGALGLPARVMLPGTRYVLWYWGYDGEQTPWYPSLRLFRGPARVSWRTLAGQVAADIDTP